MRCYVVFLETVFLLIFFFVPRYFLQVSRSPARISLRQSFHNCIVSLSVAFRAKNLRILLRVHPWLPDMVVMDQERVHQVFMSLFLYVLYI
jgi:hypothetical protein